MSPLGTEPLWARDAIDAIQSAPQTFSSWDRCMNKAYCKYASTREMRQGAH